MFENPGDSQEVNCPKGKRSHPGVRQCAHWLGMTWFFDTLVPPEIPAVFFGLTKKRVIPTHPCAYPPCMLVIARKRRGNLISNLSASLVAGVNREAALPKTPPGPCRCIGQKTCLGVWGNGCLLRDFAPVFQIPENIPVEFFTDLEFLHVNNITC